MAEPLLTKAEVETLPSNGVRPYGTFEMLRATALSLFSQHEADAARIAELERERDVAVKAWKLADGLTVNEMHRAEAAEAQVARLRDALQAIVRDATKAIYAGDREPLLSSENYERARAALGKA